MATENKRLNVNQILWSTADTTFVPADGELWYYYETAGSILSVVGDGSSTVQELRDGAYITQVDNLGLSEGRTAFQELKSGTLSTSGWYTIAEGDVAFGSASSAMFKITAFGAGGRIASKTISAEIINNGTARTYENTTIEILGKAIGNNDAINSFRLAKSDSVGTSGSKLQVYCNISTTIEIVSEIIGNTSNIATGFTLVTPYLDDTPTLPDGVTTATFIEAGAEYNLNTSINNTFSSIILNKATDDQLRVSILWPEIPKQGTGLVITTGLTDTLFIDGAGVSSPSLGSYTVTNFSINGKNIEFYLNQTGIATSLNAGPIVWKNRGTGGKLTITG